MSTPPTPPVPAARFRLVVLSGDLRGEVRTVLTDAVVGRGSACDIFTADAKLSRRHARFFVENDALYIEDLASSNGTLVNGQRVERVRLAAGDVVAVGLSQFLVEDPRSLGERGPRDSEPDALTPQFVKPVGDAPPPSLNVMVAEEYFRAIGLAREAA